MDRKGLSFTLTIVVAGVVLLMTALSLITLGGTSLTQWFDTVMGQSEDQVQQSDIQEACQRLKRDINQNYCQQYVPQGYNGPDTADQCVENDGIFCGSDSEIRDAYDEDAWGAPSAGCGGETSRRQVARSLELANQTRSAYEVTASEAQCDWDNYGDLPGFQNNPTVTVDGNTYNCQTEGYISSGVCPAQ